MRVFTIIHWVAGGGEDSARIKGGRWEDNVQETWEITWVRHIVLSLSHIFNIWPKYLLTNRTDSIKICSGILKANVSLELIFLIELISYIPTYIFVPDIELIIPFLKPSNWFSGCERLLVKRGWWQKCGTERTFQNCGIFLNWVSKIWISWHVSKIGINMTFLKERKNINQKVPSFPDVSILYLSLLPLTFAKKETTVTRCDITCHFTDIWKV